MRRNSITLWMIVFALGICLGGCTGKTVSPVISEKGGADDGVLHSQAVVSRIGPDSIDENLETPLAVSQKEKMLTYPSPGEYVAFSLRVAQHMIADVGNGKDYRTLYPQVYNLGGINKIHGLVYDQENKDTILVGRYVPTRQPITLDDVVVALKARFIYGTWPVVSLDPTQDSPTTGLQNVRFEGGIEDTQFGADLLDADHRLKRMAIGHLPSGVPGLTSSFDFSMEQLTKNPNSQNEFHINSRFWFYPVLPSVTVRQDVVAMKGLQVGVFTEVLSAEIEGEKITDLTEYKDAANDTFARAVSNRFKELGQVHPSFSRVQGLDELVALTKAIEQMEDPPEFEWWFDSYQVKKVTTPTRVQVLKRKKDYKLPISEGYVKGYREASGGVQLMAVALRLQSGDVTALKEAVVTTRPKPASLTWSFVVGEWIIPTSPDMLIMKNIVPLFAQAKFLRNQKRYDSAITLYGKILELKPDLVQAFINRGVAYQEVGQFDEALANYEQALSINPRLLEAFANRGTVFGEKGQIDRALADFEQVLTINPRLAEAYVNRGNVYTKTGRTAEAIADFTHALELNPRDAYAYNNRGTVYAKTGRTAEAIVDYTRALEFNSRYGNAYYNRGSAYAKTGQAAEALADFTHALELNPRDANAYNNRGLTFAETGRTTEAVADFNHALEFNSRYGNAYYNRGNTYRALGHFSKAIADYNRALEFDPNNAFTYVDRGRAYGIMGRFEEAINDFTSAISLNPQLPEAYNDRGTAYANSGRKSQACHDLRRASELGIPKNYQIMRRNGYC